MFVTPGMDVSSLVAKLKEAMETEKVYTKQHKGKMMTASSHDCGSILDVALGYDCVPHVWHQTATAKIL